MSKNPRKKSHPKGSDHAILASEMLIRGLQDLGFELDSSEVLFRKARPRLKVDFVFHRGDKQFAVEVKFSRQINLAFMHLLPRAILRLQAANRLSSMLSVVAIAVDRLESKDIQRMAEYMNLYAPEMGWFLLDMQGRGVFRDQENDQYAFVNEGQVEWAESLLSIESWFSFDPQISLFDRPRESAGPDLYQSSAISSSSSSSSLSSSFSCLEYLSGGFQIVGSDRQPKPCGWLEMMFCETCSTGF